MALLTVDDLSPLTSLPADKLDVMIRDVEARAASVAPCLADPAALSYTDLAAVVATLRGAVLRWADRMSRDDRQMTAGPFTIGPVPGQQTREAGALLWPSEIAQLQGVCAAIAGRSPSTIGQVRLGTPAWWVR